ncbi:MAG TPA: CHC2 zinc finger domain-containing protein [Candidatus Binatia bacterium]|nr:CHC2 zinc finger domain-containing protein [Candidatus Binatia bacterium]
MKFTPETNRRYFELRLPGQRLSTHREQQIRCPFHDDRTPSFSLNIDKGTWNCHAGCGGGGVLDFEEKFSRCDRDTARANIAELLGEKQIPLLSQKREPQATYRYTDAFERLIFEKLRFPHVDPRSERCPCGRPEDPQCSAREKHFSVRRPDGNGGWIYTLRGYDGPRPLYRLPEVLVANYICIVEGEKDADTIRTLKRHGSDSSSR